MSQDSKSGTPTASSTVAGHDGSAEGEVMIQKNVFRDKDRHFLQKRLIIEKWEGSSRVAGFSIFAVQPLLLQF